MFVSTKKAYLSVVRVYGGKAKFKIKMFMIYDRKEVMKIGYNPPEGSSGGGPIFTTELLWFNPIRKDAPQSIKVKIPVQHVAHELGRIFFRQPYRISCGWTENWQN